jgi:hypothetical protein
VYGTATELAVAGGRLVLSFEFNCLKAMGDAEPTTSVTVAECVKLPLVPVMVSGNEPVGVVLAVARVSVELPDPPLIDVGLNVPVAPVGNPLTLRDTVPVNPPCGETLAV